MLSTEDNNTHHNNIGSQFDKVSHSTWVHSLPIQFERMYVGIISPALTVLTPCSPHCCVRTLDTFSFVCWHRLHPFFILVCNCVQGGTQNNCGERPQKKHIGWNWRRKEMNNRGVSAVRGNYYHTVKETSNLLVNRYCGIHYDSKTFLKVRPR